MISNSTRYIAECSRILSLIVTEIFENNYLKEIAPKYLSKTQFSILRILLIGETYAVSEITDILQISKPAASKNVEKLVQFKLVDRQIIEKDRRSVQVSLLRNGIALIKAYEKLRLEKQQKALSKFTKKEKDQLSSLLGKYVRNCLSQEKRIEAICLHCKVNIDEECLLSEYNKNCHFYLNNKGETIVERSKYTD